MTLKFRIKVRAFMASSQVLNIPYFWEAADYVPKFEDEETGETRYGTRKYRIFIWGHDQFNDPVCWIVEDFWPHLYVKFEREIDNLEQLAPLFFDTLNKNLLSYLKQQSSRKVHLKSLLRMKQVIEGFIMEERRPLFYYTEDKDKVFKVFFQLEALMTLCYEYLEKNPIVFENGSSLPAKAYHNGDSDRIPTVEKLMVEKDLQRCSWMFAQGKLVTYDKITTLDKEFTINYNTMNMLPEEYALKLGYPKPSTVSFDAECFSAIFTRFPKASRLTDCMYAIGFRHRVYSSLQDKKGTIVNYIIIIWDNEKYGDLKDYSHIYGKTVYIYCKTEEDFLASIFQLLIRLDPTFIVSFNGLGFDWDYIEQRCEILGVKVPNLSRIKSWNKSQFKKKDWKIFRSTWPNYMGRMDVDMLYLIRLQFKMNSYKLKDVCKEFWPKEPGKVDLKYKDQFKYFADKDKHGMDLIAEYLLGDIYLPEKLYDKLSMPVYLHTNASVMRVNPLSLYVEGQSIRCICQLYSDVVKNGMYINSRVIWKAGKYIGGLVFDQIPGIYPNVLTFDFNSLYPSEMNANNICYTSLINEERDGTKYKDEDCHIVEGDIPFIDKKTKEVIETKRYKFRYILKTKYKGLLPRIVVRLNTLRNQYKAEMEKCYGKAKKLKAQIDEMLKLPKDQINQEELNKLIEEQAYWQSEGDIWNVKQMAVKVSANSMYGFMGMKTGKFSFIEGGMSTTIAGRAAISKAFKIIIDDFGAKLIYGDTDSLMVTFPPGFITSENYAEKAKMISKHISSKFHEVGHEEINMAWENYFLWFFTITKKRYAGIKIDRENPTKMPTEIDVKEKKLLYIRGLISVRGNSCGIVYKNFNVILTKMLLQTPIQEIFSYLHDMCIKIMRREYPLIDYTFVQKLGQSYKGKSATMNVFNETLKKQGRIHKPGEDLEYVIVKTHGECLKGQRMQAPDLFIDHENVLDTMSYIISQIAKPVEQLLTCVYNDSVLTKYEKKIIRPRKPTVVQKVTPVWHLELYIRNYIAYIHKNWELVQNHIKCLRLLAENRGIINYVIDEFDVIKKMKERYGIDWKPICKNENGIVKEYKEIRKPFKSDYNLE